MCPVRHPVLHRDGKTSIVSNPTDFPEPADFASGGRTKAVQEPIVKASIIVPESQYLSPSFLFDFYPLPPSPTIAFSHPLRVVHRVTSH